MAKKFQVQLVNYLVKSYFENDSGQFAKRTGYTKQQIENWQSGKHTPHQATLRWLLSATFAPEFKVAVEFAPIVFGKAREIRQKLKLVLKDHSENCGVYSFYDSMCNVVYVGKASNGFLGEMYQQLRGNLGVAFPKAVKKSPTRRWQVVRYVSAYEVPSVEHLDYPKHVESLILRLSKPVGNKVLGNLARSTPPRPPK